MNTYIDLTGMTRVRRSKTPSIKPQKFSWFQTNRAVTLRLFGILFIGFTLLVGCTRLMQ